MAFENDLRPVIKAGPSNRALIHPEACHADNMKRDSGCCAKACNVASVGWYFWFYQRYVDHVALLEVILQVRGISSPTTKKETTSFLEVLVVSFRGLAGLRNLCAPVEGSCCDLLVRVTSSWRPSWFRPSSRPFWHHPFSLPSFHLS